MPLPWIRLDTQFPTNPKVLALVEDKKYRAAFTYISGLCYSGAHGTDGFLPELSLGFLHATRREATELVTVGLWQTLPGGWEINGWNEFQQSSEEAAKRKRDAKAAAHARWLKARENGGKA